MRRGMVRITYAGRKTVFEYRDTPREAVEELIVGHMQRFAFETVYVDKQPVRTEVDQRALRAEFVENLGKPNQTVEAIPTPGLPDEGPAVVEHRTPGDTTHETPRPDRPDAPPESPKRKRGG